METDLDILDTQILVYAANDETSWATDLHDEILDGERIVFLPRYVLSEFYQVMVREQDSTGKDLAWEHITALWDSPAAVMCHPNRFRVDVGAMRHHATARTLAAVCEMEPKDAPILATAYRLAEFVEAYDPPHHTQQAIPNSPEEFRLKRLLNEAGVDSITSRILTNENNFVGVDLEDVGLESVSVKRIP